MTEDLKRFIDFTKDRIISSYPYSDNNKIYYIISILEAEGLKAYNIISKHLMTSQINEIKETCYITLEEMQQSKNLIPLIDIKEELPQLLKEYGDNADTSHVLLYLLENDSFSMNLFKKNGFSTRQLNSYMKDVNEKKEEITDDTPKKHVKKNTSSDTKRKKTIKESDNDVEKFLINLNKQSAEGKIPSIIENEKVTNEILKTFLKRDNNNVILVGENGTGKTSTARHIANLILSNKVPKDLEHKVLMELDFDRIITGTALRGSLEARLNGIISDAKIANKYIVLIDDIENMPYSNGFVENASDTILDMLINESKINVIITTTPSGYSALQSKEPSLISKLNKITINEPSEKKCIQILNHHKEKYEVFHNVIFDDEAIIDCIYLCKRFLNGNGVLTAAIDVLDETGAHIRMNKKPNEKISVLKEKLNEIENEKSYIMNENSFKNADKVDELTKKEIHLKSLISNEEKLDNTKNEPFHATTTDIRETIAKKTGLPLKDINEEDKDKLKQLNENIKKKVVGQDEAVDEVCKVVKRQRLGLSNPNKPAVLMFTGTTGTGKTYLAKKLSEQVFGDEKYMVRLDMSEYSDKMAAAKLIGSGAGYIGYDQGGLLTEAIKKNKHCVLLLDECEKADETVFNMMLQVFDDGQLTDNKGVKVDFKNVIIIMTSNVGAQEASERNGGVGFNVSDNIDKFEKSIYEKAIKRHFKPEFINRIDKIVFFKRLSNENLKDIISLEIDKIDNRLQKIGYSIDKDSYVNLINDVLANIEDKKEYGARPIIRELQTLIEDKIADNIINNDIEKGHKFTYEEITTS